MSASALPTSVDAMLELLTSRGYLAERSLATVTYLALRMGRPLFLEGEAGVGKTEIAKVLSAALGRKLIRLQCYEGLDVASAVYEWNSASQMIAIRLAEAAGDTDRDQLGSDIFADRFLIKRPLLQALEPDVAGAFGFGDADGDHLRGVIPFVDRRRNVEALVALQPDQPAAERLREHLGDLGLADAGLAFQENRPAHLERQIKHGAERAVGEIIGPGEEIDGGVDRGRQVLGGRNRFHANWI